MAGVFFILFIFYRSEIFHFMVSKKGNTYCLYIHIREHRCGRIMQLAVGSGTKGDRIGG